MGANFSCTFPLGHEQKIFVVCGKGCNIELDNVREGCTSIVLAELPIRTSCLVNPLIKIDFSTIIEVDDGNEVELLIALKRHCGRDCDVLHTWELEFEEVELLPFSFTYCDDSLGSHRGCCIYTVEIVKIDVEGGNNVDEIETSSTFINAVVQG